jgi:hypothetical protein
LDKKGINNLKADQAQIRTSWDKFPPKHQELKYWLINHKYRITAIKNPCDINLKPCIIPPPQDPVLINLIYRSSAFWA